MLDGWPPLTQPDLLAHLGSSDEQFDRWLLSLFRAIPAREFTEELYREGLAYPWARPAGSFRLDGDREHPLDDLSVDPSEAGTRYPLLAFGSNGAPQRLRLKLGAMPDDERGLIAVVGELRDFDVVAAAHPAIYGALPATLAPSTDTAVTTTLLWVSLAQLTLLAATELTYRLGRLDPVRFQPALVGAEPVTRVYAFASRIGALAADGGPYALAAVPARGRTLPAATQEQLMGRLARLGYGPDETAADLAARMFADFAAVAERLRPLVLSTALPFACEQWTPFPAAQARVLDSPGA